jgi:hypothetical protein
MMLTAQHAIYLETRSQDAHQSGLTDEAIRYAKMRDIVLLRLHRSPSEFEAYTAWLCGHVVVENSPGARLSKGAEQ